MQCGAVRERKKLKKLTQKAKCYVRLFVRNVQNKQTSKDRKGLGGREVELEWLMGTGPPSAVMGLFWNQVTGVMAAQHCECTKRHS